MPGTGPACPVPGEAMGPVTGLALAPQARLDRTRLGGARLGGARLSRVRPEAFGHILSPGSGAKAAFQKPAPALHEQWTGAAGPGFHRADA